MAETTLAKKLGLKPGQRMALLNAPDGFRERLHPLPEGAELAETLHGAFDCALVFTREQAVVERDAPAVRAAVKPGGLLWLAYPKLTSKVKTDLTRDRGWDSMFAAGWRPVSLVAIDDIWSALRFRPEADVRTK
ncbi:MAG TPA: hypothetical protein VF120_11340 [Ktedonobacterales bacterium]